MRLLITFDVFAYYIAGLMSVMLGFVFLNLKDIGNQFHANLDSLRRKMSRAWAIIIYLISISCCVAHLAFVIDGYAK